MNFEYFISLCVSVALIYGLFVAKMLSAPQHALMMGEAVEAESPCGETVWLKTPKIDIS